MNYSYDMNYSAFHKQRNDEFDAAMQKFCSLLREHPEWIKAFKVFLDFGMIRGHRGWRDVVKTLDDLGLIEKVDKDWL